MRVAGDEMPILVLTARDPRAHRPRRRLEQVVVDAGADDYLPKPFALEELLARLRALLPRRSSDDGAAGAATLRFADLSLDPDTREVRRGERTISLPAPSSRSFAQERAGLGEEQFREHQRGGGAVDEEVVELDGGADEARGGDLADRGLGDGLRAGTNVHRVAP
jgi:hypothetical protein